MPRSTSLGSGSHHKAMRGTHQLEISSIRSRLWQSNLYGLYFKWWVCRQSSLLKIFEKKENTGLVGLIYTIAAAMLLFNLGLFTASNSMSSDNPWMATLCSGSIFPLISSTILAGFASYYKESELVDDLGFRIVIILLVFHFIHFYIVLFIILKVRANVSLTVVLSTGVSGACLIVFIGVISVDQTRQFMKKWTKVTFQFLKKWTMIMWDNMGCYLYLTSQIQSLPEP